MKALLSVFLLIAASTTATAADVKDDPTALQILDHMSNVIGQLGSCSYTLNTESDVNDPDLGLVTYHASDEVHMLGPNRMLIRVNSDSGNKGYWYDGKHVTYYSYDENNYATVDATGTIMETIDQIHRDFDIDFPAADFLYPTFTDDLIEYSDRIVLLGRAIVEGRSCFHILATSPHTGIQLWIADDALGLPMKYSIASYDEAHTPQYVATFSDWSINPDLPAAIFDFVPPKTAAKITLLPKRGE